MTRKHFIGTAGFFALVLLLSACGRSGMLGDPVDIPDAGPDAMGDGPPACNPTCENLCNMQKDCGIIQPDRVTDCVNQCKADPKTPELVCLANVYCAPGSMDCSAAKTCITNPTAPDLTMTFSASSPADGQISYQGQVCNNGTGAATTFRVHFYRNLTNPPTPGQKGDRSVQVSSLSPGACQPVNATDVNLPKGVYNTWAQADAENAVVEMDEANNISGPQQVKVDGGTGQLPDLVVSNLTAYASQGGVAHYTLTVCNAGAVTSGATTVDLYYDRGSPPSSGSGGDTVAKVPGLSPGACASSKISAKLKPGTYRSWAFVDRGNQVKESSEANNVKGPFKLVVGGPGKLPDLVVSSMTVATNVGGVTYTPTVCNFGKSASSSSLLGLYVNRSSPPGPYDTPDKELSVSSLGPGTCVKLSWSTYLKQGSYKSWALADRKNNVPEFNEGNNAYGPVSFTVSGPGYKPDLVVGSLSANSSSSGATTYALSVCNKGQANSSATTVDLYYNRSSAPPSSSAGNQALTVKAMAPGACVKLSAKASLKPGATYLSWARVDRGNQVGESNEGNNVYGPHKFTAGSTTNKPNLKVTKLSANSSGGSTTYYYATVCNQGQASSGSTIVEVYFNRGSAPSAGTKGDTLSTVPALKPGACTTRTLYGSLPSGTYQSWAYVDRQDVVSESSETDNVVGPIKVTVGGTTNKADLVVTNVSTTISSYGYLYYYITVCNKGKASVKNATVDVYYNRSTAPPASEKGDKYSYVYNLAGGACTTRTITTVLSPGTYKSWVRLDRSNVIPESNESNNVYGPVTVKVPGSGKPDLQVINISTSQSSTSSYTYYYVTVCNKGTAKSGSAYIDVYYDSASTPPATTPGNVNTYLSYLNPGACTTRTLYATLSAGTYKSWARVDRKDQVLESNESNNVYGPVTVKVSGSTAKPDLYVTKIDTSTSPYGYLYYYVTVCNKGKATAGLAYLDLYYNRTSAPPVSVAGDKYTTVYNLKAGDCTKRTIYANLGNGTYQSWVRVDRTNAVLETDETNNVFGPKKVVVGGSTGQADLQVTGIKTTTSSYSGYTYYYVTICNYGKGNSGSTTVDLYYNRSSAPPASLAGDKYTTVYPLGAGSCATRTIYTKLSAGSYSSWARVDRQNSVTETNENNNVHGPVKVTIQGGTADLQITSLKAYPSSFTSTVYYYATICNYGKAASAGTDLDLYFDRSSAPPTSLKGNKTTTVPGLNPGACTTRYLSAKLGSGKYSSWARIDRQDAVSESNENNNVYGPVTFQVGANKADLVINSFYGVSTSGSNVTYYATVCNTGKSSAGSTYLDIYYNRSSAPGPNTPGNTTVYVPALGSGKCSPVTKAVKLSSGTYASWAQVDRVKAVSESNENNNVKGPYTVKVGLSDAQKCAKVCNTLINPCKMIPSSTYSLCVSACTSQTSSKIDCAYKAAQSSNCSGIIGCLGTSPPPGP